MTSIVGWAAIAIGLGIMAYVGIYLCLYLGIVEAITALQTTPWDRAALAGAVVKIVLFETIGLAAGAVPMLIGYLFLSDHD